MENQIEEPTKSQLKDQNLFLKHQVDNLRRNYDIATEALQRALARIKELRRPPRRVCNNTFCSKKTQKKCKECGNFCCQSCRDCDYCNSPNDL